MRRARARVYVAPVIVSRKSMQMKETKHAQHTEAQHAKAPHDKTGDVTIHVINVDKEETRTSVETSGLSKTCVRVRVSTGGQ